MYNPQQLTKLLKHAVNKKIAITTGLTVGSLLLYVLGIRFLLLPVLVVANAWYLPMPRIFKSWVSRLIVGTLLVMTLLQIGTSLLAFVLPKSGFVALAVCLCLLQVILWLCAPQRVIPKVPIISANDLCGLVVAVCFLLPFTPILIGHGSIQRIATIGSEQAIDATNHYNYIAESTRSQNLNYGPGKYYPRGFHVATGFMQNTIFTSQYTLGWTKNVILYFTDYLMYGALLGYILYFVCLSWLKSLKGSLIPEGWAWSKLLLAFCLAVPLTLFYLLPFVSEGFLNYYYVCVTLFCGLIFLNELHDESKATVDSLDFKHDVQGRWYLLVYLLLMFGASASWPLVIPPFAFTALLFVLPGRLTIKTLMSRLWTPRAIPVVLAFALQLIPIYFQLKYPTSGGAGTQGLNATGSISQFQPYVLLAGLALVVYVAFANKTDQVYRRVLMNIFIPLFVMLALITLYQYFSLGEVRYYVIKVSELLELLLVALGVVVLVGAFISSKLYEARYAWALPLLPLLIMLLLISGNVNPMQEVRDLFRSRSQDVIPQYLGTDVQSFVKLGEAGKIEHFNATLLHYDAQQGKFFADMQVPYFADAMQYNATPQDHKAVACIGSIYGNLAFGPYTEAYQQLLLTQIKACAAEAKQHGYTFYVVTDSASEPFVQNFLGNSGVTIVD